MCSLLSSVRGKPDAPTGVPIALLTCQGFPVSLNVLVCSHVKIHMRPGYAGGAVVTRSPRNSDVWSSQLGYNRSGTRGLETHQNLCSRTGGWLFKHDCCGRELTELFTRDSTESLVYDILQLNVLHTGRLMIHSSVAHIQWPCRALNPAYLTREASVLPLHHQHTLDLSGFLRLNG
ncbi:hypothetical protein T265_11071 [Opisthorchis viverrini]|uniref:Uncharacterized protein n=1 Tax=Opisthorchis viverrini TaxID=6198 RepID=A0A074ZAV8_OPIVI|nr:hypothetical protein T265_11071 [Opisthorchis viverrini]KER20375.1 hypothetical protein T265_11071 [Opisthorchis viverrini]